jgi:GT2 family glycosyltransferase
MESRDGRVAVVVVTRNRRPTTLATVRRLERLPEAPLVIVVDNASTDGTADAVRTGHPGVRVVRLPTNMGAAGRNCGAALAPTPYVAFSDDDSWWAPGALTAAADLFDGNPPVALVAGRVLVGREQRLDPVCEAMAASPLPAADGPGRAVLGFVACGCVVRRSAFLGVGGFRLGYGIGGEEELLAIDLSAAGWAVRYCPELLAHHEPATDRPPGRDRRRLQARNALRTAWLRRRPAGVVRRSAHVAWQGRADPAARRALADAVRDLGWIWHERGPVDRALEGDLRVLSSRARTPADR